MSDEAWAAMIEREDLVFNERLVGKSFYRIKVDHGIPNPERVYRRAMRRRAAENSAAREDLVRLEGFRLDDLQAALWPRAQTGDTRAVEVMLKVFERRARLLGLDFADLVSGKMVEIEQQKVELMAAALTATFADIGLNAQQQRLATATFFDRLRVAAGGRPIVGEDDTPASEDVVEGEVLL